MKFNGKEYKRKVVPDCDCDQCDIACHGDRDTKCRAKDREKGNIGIYKLKKYIRVVSTSILVICGQCDRQDSCDSDRLDRCYAKDKKKGNKGYYKEQV